MASGAKSFHSSLILGQVVHSRFRPTYHHFRYPIFYLRIDLNELEQMQGTVFGVNRWRPLAFHEKDYGPRDGSPLLPWIRHLLASHGIAADGKIFLQSIPRIFGFAFNPISLWYCYDQGQQLLAVLAEVNNTFGEHHFYLLQTGTGAAIGNQSILQAQKLFHVSPFCQVQGHYKFRFFERAQHCACQIDYFDLAHAASAQNSQALIHTALAGKKLPFSQRLALKTLLSQPFLALGVVFKIHWQALRLWRKGLPFFGRGQINQSAADQAADVSANKSANNLSLGTREEPAK